ncbi:MAG: helix-turn-helix domain-containing protein [Proteobacteria bacterium]|nr:helix-turn-helix domain-containing protein [Pseudomonadota bacterium]
MPVRLRSSRPERRSLGRELRKRQLPHFEAMRIRTVLRLMKDPCVSACAEAFGIDRKTVRLWRDRYREGVREALETRCRCGGPIRIDAVSRCQVVSMACATGSMCASAASTTSPDCSRRASSTWWSSTAPPNTSSARPTPPRAATRRCGGRCSMPSRC